MATFDENIEMCLQTWEDFLAGSKEIHDMSMCTKVSCDIGIFTAKLHQYVFSRWRSPCLVRGFFINLCKKYPQDRVIKFFRSKYQNEPRESNEIAAITGENVKYLNLENIKMNLENQTETAVIIEKEIEYLNSYEKIDECISL